MPQEFAEVRLIGFQFNGAVSPVIQATRQHNDPASQVTGRLAGMGPALPQTANLDGNIVLSFQGEGSPQASTLAWKTDGAGQLVDADRYANYLVFYGTYDDFLSIKANVTRTSDSQDWQLAGKVAAALSAGVGLVPGPGAIAAAGLALLSTLFNAIAAASTDILQFLFLGTTSPAAIPAADGGKFVLTRPAVQGKNPVALLFHVTTGPVPTDSPTVSLFLQRIDLAGSFPDDGQLVLSGTFGSGDSQRPFSLQAALKVGATPFGDVVQIHNAFLCHGKQDVGIPFTLSASIVRDSAEKDTLTGIADPALSLAAAAGATINPDPKNISKAFQGATELVTLFLPRSQSLGSKSDVLRQNGQIVLGAPGGPRVTLTLNIV